MAWLLDVSRRIWKCTNYSDLNYAEINNFAEYGQPHSPYEYGFDHTFIPDFKNVVIEMPQLEVMSNGYGRDIRASSFPVVDRFLKEKLPMGDGSYDFDMLVARGFAKPADRWIRTNLYGLGGYGIQAGSIDGPGAAYVHGTVSLAILKSSRFISSGNNRRVEAEMGAGDDNWDFNSSTVPAIVNATVAALFGPTHYNLEAPIKILYRGPGRKETVERQVNQSPFKFGW